jgi:hypothetical protein
VIAPRLFHRHEVEQLLQKYGCVLVEEVASNGDTYYQASIWRTGWGFHFTVPELTEDKMVYEHRLYEILADLARRNPNGS